MMGRLTTLASQMILAAEGGEKKAAEAGIVDGPIVEFAWLIIVVPILATFVILFFGKRSVFKGWLIAWLGMGFVMV